MHRAAGNAPPKPALTLSRRPIAALHPDADGSDEGWSPIAASSGLDGASPQYYAPESVPELPPDAPAKQEARDTATVKDAAPVKGQRSR